MRQQIYLSNTLSRNVFPDNTSGDFTNVLCEPIPPRHSISVSEVYYKPMGWHNIRTTNNKILMEFSEIAVQKRPNHLGGFRHETHKVTAIIPNALYTDVFQLMRAIVQAMNYEAVEFFKLYWRMRATIGEDTQFGLYGDGGAWFHRTGNDSLGIPEWKEEEQEHNPWEAKVLQEQFKWRWVVPREWDPNCVYSRFYYMTIVNGRVRLGRFRDQAKHRMRVSFSVDIAQLLGFKLGGGGEREWHTFERDPIALNYSGDDIP